MLSELRFASFLVYPPRPSTQRARLARSSVLRIKSDAAFDRQTTWTEFAARRLREETERGAAGFEEYLGREVTLVPVPRSGLLRPDSLWPAQRITECLVAQGLGRAVLSCLERLEPLPASHLSNVRPDLREKFRTLGIRSGTPTMTPGSRPTIVDDVVTEGETLLAAASRVAEAFPRAQIRGFAIARTRGSVTDVEDPKDPHLGLIELTGENSVRRDD